MTENLIGSVAEKLRGKLGKLIQGKLSETEFQEIVRDAVKRELAALKAAVNKNSEKERTGNHVRSV